MAKATADIRSLARAQTALAIRTLTGVCGSKAAPAAARVSAASALLDRGWGKAPQPHTGEDDKDIRITIRNITESKDDRHRPAAQRLGPAAEQRAYGGISTTASVPSGECLGCVTGRPLLPSPQRPERTRRPRD